MSCVNVTEQPSTYSFRKPFRQDGLFAILDATGFDSLAATLRHSDLEYESLFSGEDAVLLEEEAPFIVALEREKSASWKPILRYAQHRNAGIIVASKEDLGKVRRHWKKWLSVTLPDQEKPVLFRFYDPRILFAFVTTLAPTDAAAFFGPITDIAAFQQDNLQILTPAEEVTDLDPRPLGALAGGLYAVTPAQMQAMEDVAGQEFRERLKKYLRIVWWEQAEHLPEEELDQIVDKSLEYCERSGRCNDVDVRDFSVLQLTNPEVLNIDDYWRQALNHEVLTQGGASFFLLVATYQISVEGRAIFYYKLNLSGQPETSWPVPNN